MRRSIRYSQNFLRPSPLLDRLVANTSIGADDVVLDIGAGKGTLARLVARRCKEVIAIEADARLAADLQQSFASISNITVRHSDFMAMPLPNRPYKVFANIPFNRTSDIIRKLLDTGQAPVDCYLIMQREAAEKFAGTMTRQTLFSIMHAPRFAMEVVHEFRSSDFTPEPNVAVVLLRITPWPEPLIATQGQRQYEDFVSYIFNHSNPTMLQGLEKLFPPKILAQLRSTQSIAKPSELAPAAWVALFHDFLRSATPKQLNLINGAADKLRHEASTIEKHHRTRQSTDWRNAS